MEVNDIISVSIETCNKYFISFVYLLFYFIFNKKMSCNLVIILF